MPVQISLDLLPGFFPNPPLPSLHHKSLLFCLSSKYLLPLFPQPSSLLDILWLVLLFHHRRTCGLVGLEIRREMGSRLECAIF